MRINHNITSLNSYARLTSNTLQTAKNLEKLSSGYRINKASDDAAGLAISEKMRGQIRGLNQASRNAQDAISLIQTAEGGAAGIHAMLQRGRELAVQSANGTLTSDDRSKIQAEMNQIIKQIDFVAENTEFNTIKLLNSSGDGSSQFSGISQVALDDLTSKLPGWINDGLVSIHNQLGIAYPAGQRPLTIEYYSDSASSAAASMSTADMGATLKLSVNVAKVFNNGSLIPEGSIDTLIAHEMVHALEFTQMNFVFDGTQPLSQENWFVEGLAVAIQGGNGFLPSDNNVNLVSPFDGDYGSAYQAIKVLHEITTGGISAFIDRLEAGDTLDQAFANTTQDITGTELATATGSADFATSGSFIAWFNNNATNNVLNYLNDTSTNDFSAGTGAIVQGSTQGSSGNLTLDQTITNGTGTATLNTYYSVSFSNSTNTAPVNNLTFFIGANADQSLGFIGQNLSSSSLGVKTLDLSSASSANLAITILDGAISKVSSSRSYFGAMQNRLEHTIANLDTSAENLTSSESRVRDVDMAKEMMEFTKNNILSQAAQAMLAQANQQPQGVLQLLR